VRLVVPVPDLRHAADERPADRPEQPRDRRRRRPAGHGQLSRAYTPALTTSAVEVQVLVAASRIAAVDPADPADPADPMETVDRRLRACGVHGGRPGAARRGRLVEPAPARRVGEDKRVLGVRPASWRVAELRGGAVAEPVAQWRRLARNTISRPGRTGPVESGAGASLRRGRLRRRRRRPGGRRCCLAVPVDTGLLGTLAPPGGPRCAGALRVARRRGVPLRQRSTGRFRPSGLRRACRSPTSPTCSSPPAATAATARESYWSRS